MINLPPWRRKQRKALMQCYGAMLIDEIDVPPDEYEKWTWIKFGPRVALLARRGSNDAT